MIYIRLLTLLSHLFICLSLLRVVLGQMIEIIETEIELLKYLIRFR